MSKCMKKMLLLAAVETVEGQDALPTAAANAILCRAITPEPIVVEQVERNLIRPYKGNGGTLSAAAHRKISFEVELAGAGTAGTAPAWGPLLQACGFAETINAGTDVQYDPVSDGEPTLSIYCIVDGSKFAMLGCRGTVKFTLNAKAIPIMQFEFVGSYVKAAEVNMPTNVDYSAFLQPRVMGVDETPTFTFYSLSSCISSFDLDWAADIKWRSLINCEGAVSPDRKPSGTIVLEMPKVGTMDWAEVVKEGTQGACAIVHGKVAGNIIEIQAPALQCSNCTLQDDDSVATLSLPFAVNPVQGDDELRIIVR